MRKRITLQDLREMKKKFEQNYSKPVEYIHLIIPDTGWMYLQIKKYTEEKYPHIKILAHEKFNNHYDVLNLIILRKLRKGRIARAAKRRTAKKMRWLREQGKTQTK